MTIPDGFQHLPGALDLRSQTALLAAVHAVIAAAPLYTPTMPKTGKPLSVRMTNCGPLGWVTDKAGGYRYQPAHPVTGHPWPAMPPLLLELWQQFASGAALPQACLINWYEPDAKLGLHRDEDEEDFSTPVLSISLGDDAWFRIGGLKRRDPSERILLRSGDIVILGGEARLAFHGIDRLLAGSGKLLETPGRFNLTLRRVTKPGD